MFSDAKAPELGCGPYGVEHDEDTGFYYLTIGPHRVADAHAYPLAKTAYKACRQRNGEHRPETRPEGQPVTVSPNLREDDPAPEDHSASHSTVVYQGTREEWLNAFTAAARPIFAERDHPLPEKVHASFGFMFRSSKAIGQCWRPEASEDGVSQVFISPVTGGDNSRLIAGILTHELCHAVTPGDKHGKLFGACARAMGLEGKLTQACDGPDFWAWAERIVEALGECPHSRIDPTASGVKKQKTRLLKGECVDCGFTLRLTAKWVNAAVGELQCPDSECCGVLNVVVEGE